MKPIARQVVTIEYRAVLPVGTVVISDGVSWTRREVGLWESEFGQWGTPALPLTITSGGTTESEERSG